MDGSTTVGVSTGIQLAGATLEELAKKYGYSDLRRITEFIEVFKRKEDIFRIVGDASPIGIYKALKVLRELKQKEKKGSWKA